MSALIQVPTKEQAASVTEEMRCVPAGIADSSSIVAHAALHYKLSVAGQNGVNKRSQKVRFVPVGI